jgi:hypothetical protein
MQSLRRSAFRYTAYFCEENVWWLARSLTDAGIAAARMQVLLFSNATQSVLLLNQRAAQRGQPVAWDYHVVLRVDIGESPQVLDLDTRLDFPTTYLGYLRETFLPQSELPERYRTWVRCIPAASYLAHFHSDRSHMRGRLPAEAYPDYPVIQPVAGSLSIDLADYRDMRKPLPDGSLVQPLSVLCPEVA